MSDVPDAMTEFLPYADDDEFERELLTSERHEHPDPDDPHYPTLATTMSEVARVQSGLNANRRNIARYYARGVSNKAIAEKLALAPGTVAAAIHNPHVRRLVQLHQQVNAIHTGPKTYEKAQLLWRIAQRTELSDPRVSIQAMETLNKMAGLYQPTDKNASNQPLTVVVQQFVLDHDPAHPVIGDTHAQLPPLSDDNPPFKPVVIDMKPDA